MPKINQRIVHSAFYLYASRIEAEAGKDPGGTGFIVGHQETPSGPMFYYAVSNWHVACDGGYSVIRLNRKDGGVDIIDLDPSEWEFVPGGVDVAVVEIKLDGRVHLAHSISTPLFASGNSSIGVGEDVFMLGLFADHSGIATNVPAARFGNISMLPSRRAPIQQPTGYNGECYVIDLHSRSGFSGSPVFAFRTLGSDLTAINPGEVEMDNWAGRVTFKLKDNSIMFKFLGIHFGQFPERWEIQKGTSVAEAKRKHLITDGAYVEGLSGMTCVIPSWRVLEVLNMPRLVERRARVIERFPSPKGPKASH